MWVNCHEQIVLAIRHKVSLGGEVVSEHTKHLTDLQPGQHMFIRDKRGAGNIARFGTIPASSLGARIMINISSMLMAVGSNQKEHECKESIADISATWNLSRCVHSKTT